MKAIQVNEFGGPEVMRLNEVPVPEPKEDEVLVKVHAAGVNPVDTYIRSGQYATKPNLPFVPGFDAAGEIAKAGSALKGYQPGSRVYCAGSLTGTYAEYTLCKGSQVHPLPKNVSYEKGACVNVPYATAYRAIFQKAKAQAGEMMLVHGASGGVGNAAVQLGRAAGLCVIGTAGSERGLKLIQELGAHYAVDHSKPGYIQEILEITGNKGVHIVLEMLANVNLNNDFEAAGQGARVVIIGSRGKTEIDPRWIMRKELNLHGVLLLLAPQNELYAVHSALVGGLETGIINPVIGEKFALKDAPKAHEAVAKPGAYGKVVLTIP